MRHPLTLAVLALAVAALSGQSNETLTITNVTIIDGAGTPSRVGNVTVRGVEIVAVGAAERAAGDVIDGTGRYLIPGLWDMHAHLATRPEPMLAEKMILPLLLAHGVVGVRDMGGPLERVLGLRRQVASGAIAGPRILTPGPFMDGPGEADAMFRRPADAAAAAAQVKEVVAAGADFIKAQAGLSPGLHSAIARAARDARVPLAGHIPLSMTAEEIIASGQRSIEHVSPALVGDGLLLFACSSKGPELLGELRAIERDRATLAGAAVAQREAALRQQLVETYDPAKARALGGAMHDRDVWIVPTLIWSASLRPLTPKHDGSDLPMELVPAALRTRWTERRKQFIGRQTEASFAAAAAVAATSARAVRDLHLGGARVLTGTDAFDAFVLPGVSLHQELRLLVEAGFSPLEALQAATRNAAAYRGALQREGTIAAGKRADLVILDADPMADMANLGRIHMVVIGGRAYSRTALDALAGDVKSFAAR